MFEEPVGLREMPTTDEAVPSAQRWVIGTTNEVMRAADLASLAPRIGPPEEEGRGFDTLAEQFDRLVSEWLPATARM